MKFIVHASLDLSLISIGRRLFIFTSQKIGYMHKMCVNGFLHVEKLLAYFDLDDIIFFLIEF